VDKLTSAMQSCVGATGGLDADDHIVVSLVNDFLRNLYNYGSQPALLREHLLEESSLVRESGGGGDDDDDR
jgi:hypothetical protein